VTNLDTTLILLAIFTMDHEPRGVKWLLLQEIAIFIIAYDY